jgi:hypothetical protein
METRALWGACLSAALAACTTTPRDTAPAPRPASEVQGRVDQAPPPPLEQVPLPPTEQAAPQARVEQVPAPAAPAVRIYRAGVGVVESVSVVSLPSLSAAGGATGPTMAYRLRMADGTLQDVVQVGERFELGERVQVTQEGRLARP